MRTSDMVKSKYWRAADLKGQPPVRLTIADVTEELVGRGGRQETKCFLWFQESLKGLQLNKTRVAVLEMAYGPDSVLWTGKRVRLVFDPTVIFGGQAVGGVKLETPPGIVFDASQAGMAGWGEAPVAVAGRPPAPVWDEQRQIYVTPTAPPAKPNRPPPPIWNEATRSWEFVNPQTGEIAAAAPAEVRTAAPAQSQAPRAATISERIAQGAPPDEWGSGEAGADFNDDIPF